MEHGQNFSLFQICRITPDPVYLMDKSLYETDYNHNQYMKNVKVKSMYETDYKYNHCMKLIITTITNQYG